MRVIADDLSAIQNAAKLVESHRVALYQPAQSRTGVPWVMFGLSHFREATCNPARQILNGQPWTQRTTIVPKGRGPWQSWIDAAIEAAREHDWTSIRAWSIPVILAELESYNGLGYAYRDKDSPYLWSFTNWGIGVGKFVADGQYDSMEVDKQCGVAPILKSLIDWQKWQEVAA